MSHADFHIGDSRATMRTWAAGGGIPTPWGPQRAHLILTSPPFLALRSYLPDDDPAKHLEMGSEPTPAAFLDALLDWTAACAELLSPEGSLAVELGDTYSGSGGAGGDYADGGMRDGQAKWSGSANKRGRDGVGDNPRPARTGRHGNDLGHASKDRWASSDNRPGWPLAKCKTLIPELYRIALAYGINPLTGAESPAGRWRVRNVVTWARPNPPVGALGDKYRPATSDLVIACRSDNRWFDLDAVRSTPEHGFTSTRGAREVISVPGQPDRKVNQLDENGDRVECNPAGAPPLDWWEISTEPYKGSHYATWPRELCRRPILSMCPAEVSISTGEGRRRITSEPEYIGPDGEPREAQQWASGIGQRAGAHSNKHDGCITRVTSTVGWTDTDPDGQYRPGIVLDPFAGSGTTLAVATGHGRYAVGIDLDHRNADLVTQRVGPLLLTVHDTTTEEAV